jgi:aspartate 1-decarboxylase
MNITLLKCKIHRATVTEADLNYEGSISICPTLVKMAGLREFERVEIYNCNNGARLATYVIFGKEGEICLNGAAARMVHRGDLVIIAAYASMDEKEAEQFKPNLVFVDAKNKVKLLHHSYENGNQPMLHEV